jgi:broad specificity phosphatase PhoE
MTADEHRAHPSLPERLWLVRHGESAGNVARDAAEAAGLPHFELAHRDVDVPLSALGERQSQALGRWFGSMPQGEQPTVIIASPYSARARPGRERSARAAAAAASPRRAAA